MNCAECPSYKKGKGSKACLVCPDQRDVLPRYKPNPSTFYLQADIVEELAALVPKNAKDILLTLDPLESTMLLQSIILNMTHEEIAEYHLYNATKTLQRKITKAMSLIRDGVV